MANLATNLILPHGTTLEVGGEIHVYGGCTFPSGVAVSSGNSCFQQMTVVSGVTVSDLSVGNVFPMLSNSIKNNLPVVGFVAPVLLEYPYSSSQKIVTTALPEGKWFVHFVVKENDSSGDEDPYAIMTQVWDVPSGKYLRFLTDGSSKFSDNPPLAGYTTGIFYEIGNTGGSADLASTVGAIAPPAGTVDAVRNWFSQNGWTEFVVGTNASSEYWDDTVSHETKTGVFVMGSNSLIGPGQGSGFAIKIG